jgi:hypothetical protein
MNPERRTYNTTVFLLIIFIVIISFVCIINKYSGSTFRGSSAQISQRRRIRLLYHTDHEELLKAGREILKKGPKDPMNYRYYGPQHIDGFPVPRGIRIPKVIRKLRPHASLINRNGYVVLQMQGGMSDFGVRIYPENFKGKTYYFTPGKRQLLPGLEYYDYKYRYIPQYDKVIDYVIQNGRWIEPNQIDLNKTSN